MRIRLPMRRIVLFAVLFALALLLFLPMRLVLGAFDTGISAREASGSVWSGRLKEARIGPALLGDVEARLNPLALLAGQARIAVTRDNAAPDRLSAVLIASASGRGVESATGLVPLDVTLSAFSISGVTLTDLTVRFRDGQCDHAEGLVQTSLSGQVAGVGLPASLSGAARCDAGALLLPLRSGSGTEGVTLRIAADGRYHADIRLQSGQAMDLSGRL